MKRFYDLVLDADYQLEDWIQRANGRTVLVGS